MAEQQEAAKPALRIIRPRKACEILSLGKTALYERIKNPEKFPGFPRPIPLGANAVGFLEHEIAAWIEKRIEERDAA